MKKFQLSLLEFHQRHLVLIQDSTDYDDLQQIETKIFEARSFYENFLKVEILNRNKLFNAIEKEVEIIKSNLRIDSYGLLTGGFTSFTQAKKILNAAEGYILKSEEMENDIENENNKIKTFQIESQVIFDQLQRRIAIKKRELFKGLLPARIQQFEQFQADESFVGDQCAICMGEYEIGRKMMRLDCDGQHTFCQVCIEGWFAEHNTCPICRHIFE